MATKRKGRTKHTKKYKKRKQKLKDRFLKHLAKVGFINKACELAGVSHDAVSNWCDDKKFADQMDIALDGIGQIAEQEAIRRGITGYDRPVFYEGKQVATTVEYSDKLMSLILRARNKRYKDTSDSDDSDVHVHTIIRTQASDGSPKERN